MLLYLMVTGLTIALASLVNVAYKTEYARGIGKSAVSRQTMVNKIAVLAIFGILFLLSSLRIGIGNDYWTYRQGFLYIMGGDRTLSYEFGFKALVKFLQTVFGFDNYRIVFGVFSFLTCAFFVKSLYELSEFFAFSLFLFMANGFYFMSFSNVRYYFALGICMFAMKYVFEKDYVKFVLWVLLAATFHKTALLVIPAFFVANRLKWSKKNVWLVPAAAAILFAGKTLIRKLIFVFYPFYEGDLLYDTEDVSYVNIAKCLAILVFAMVFYVKYIKDDEKLLTFFNLNLFAFLLYAFGYYIPETSRICYYMVVFQVFLIPGIYAKIKETRWKYLFIPLVLAYMGYFIMFLEKGKDGYVMILPYLTWIFD